MRTSNAQYGKKRVIPIFLKVLGVKRCQGPKTPKALGTGSSEVRCSRILKFKKYYITYKI